MGLLTWCKITKTWDNLLVSSANTFTSPHLHWKHTVISSLGPPHSLPSKRKCYPMTNSDNKEAILWISNHSFEDPPSSFGNWVLHVPCSIIIKPPLVRSVEYSGPHRITSFLLITWKLPGVEHLGINQNKNGFTYFKNFQNHTNEFLWKSPHRTPSCQNETQCPRLGLLPEHGSQRPGSTERAGQGQPAATRAKGVLQGEPQTPRRDILPASASTVHWICF